MDDKNYDKNWFEATVIDEEPDYKSLCHRRDNEIKVLKCQLEGTEARAELYHDWRDQKNEEIKRLEKEKEWLLNELLPVYVRDISGIHKPEITDESLKDLIIKLMNEAVGG